jgi:uncharacterized protein (TIGR03032 family)
MSDRVTPSPSTPRLELIGSRHFNSWLAEQQISLALTTYQAGKLFLLGLQDDGRLSIFERSFNRCMGLWADGETMWMSSLYQLWRFENVLSDGQSAEGYDRLYVPQVGYTTGQVNIHDVAVDGSGRAVFVNTLFNCLATTSDTHSFAPIWRPPFISALAAEDRCHLNGLAMESGKPRYATTISQTDQAQGWRDHRRDGGCLIDVCSDEVVAEGLSMPHSPRIYRNECWLLNSGTGHFGRVDRNSGVFERVTFCPGYLRGLALLGDFAIVGMSKPRENRTFTGLELEENLNRQSMESRCGIGVIDLRSGAMAHWLTIEGIVQELYDVVVLPRVVRPMALGFKTEEIRRTISIAPQETVSGTVSARQNGS